MTVSLHKLVPITTDGSPAKAIENVALTVLCKNKKKRFDFPRRF
jgi:hypothetical protein